MTDTAPANPGTAPRVLHTPFHSRTKVANKMERWEVWQGYNTAACYTDVELEYFAIRSNTGVFDLSPMVKYRIQGADAADYVDRLLTRNIRKLGTDRVAYVAICNDAGNVIDDGTLFRFADNEFRLCTQEHVLDWLLWSAEGFDVTVYDETADVAALAVQGPTSCQTLRRMGLDGLQELKPFGMAHYELEGIPLMVSRTGFTGDLGYELWLAPEHAETVWDRVFANTRQRTVRPIGSHALDLARIEAGFIAAGVDFVPAEQIVRNGRGRSPLELGLEWLVDFSKPVFNGRQALLQQRDKGPRYRLAKLSVEGNKPAEHAFIYCRGREVGTVTSAAWCPSAKSNFALASIKTPYGRERDPLKAEIYYMRELHWTRTMAKCEIVNEPVFNPPRRLQTPAPDA